MVAPLLGSAAATLLVVISTTVAMAISRPSQATGKAKPPAQAQAPAQATYVGEAKCLECHEDMTRGYHNSAHGRRANARSPIATQGCESCHGPGSAHADDPEVPLRYYFKKIEPKEASQACLSCHRKGDHALWDGSSHDTRNLSCVTCHSVHDPKSADDRPRMVGTSGVSATGDAASGGNGRSEPPHIGTAQLVARSEMDLCSRCHRDKIVKLDRSGHMPVREGKMQCSSCHNPHGSTNVRLLRAGHSVNDTCTRCHADKRGPYLWEHAPVTESCTTCHDPHGSANERMLVAKLPMLCQRCHIHTRHPSTIYDAAVMGTSNRLYGRSCVTCHSNIHGSNHASGNAFVR